MSKIIYLLNTKCNSFCIVSLKNRFLQLLQTSRCTLDLTYLCATRWCDVGNRFSVIYIKYSFHFFFQKWYQINYILGGNWHFRYCSLKQKLEWLFRHFLSNNSKWLLYLLSVMTIIFLCRFCIVWLIVRKIIDLTVQPDDLPGVNISKDRPLITTLF